MLNNGDSIQTDIPCVFKLVTEQLSSKIQERATVIPNFTEKVTNTIKKHYQPHLPDFQQQKTLTNENDEDRFILAVAHLGDFCSEWSATLSVLFTSAKQRRVYQNDQSFRLSRSLDTEKQSK